MKKFLFNFSILQFLFLIPFLSHAQDLPPEDVLDTPIDAWVVALIAVVVIIGARMAWRARRNRTITS